MSVRTNNKGGEEVVREKLTGDEGNYWREDERYTDVAQGGGETQPSNNKEKCKINCNESPSCKSVRWSATMPRFPRY